MSLIKLQGNASGTGALTIAAPNTNTDRTLTLPDTTGTIVMNEGSGIFKIDSSGDVGIGTSSPTSVGTSVTTLDIEGSLGGAVRFERTDATASEGYLGAFSGEFRLASIGAIPVTFRTDNTERARIDSSGVLTVGQTSSINVFSGSADGCSIEGDGAISLSRNQNASLYIRRRGNNGAVAAFLRDTTQVGRIDVTTTATAYVTSSDYRLKENVQPMTGALDTVAQLNPVTYTWKADGSAGQGFIAHELQAVVPDCVTGEKDAVDAEGNPQYQGVDTSFLVATLVKAIQELTARVAQLEAN